MSDTKQPIKEKRDHQRYGLNVGFLIENIGFSTHITKFFSNITIRNSTCIGKLFYPLF